MKFTMEEKEKLSELLGQFWTNHKGQPDLKMVEHCVKTEKYVLIDGMFINVCRAKPSIECQMWYDDTRENPGKTYQIFYDYNIRNAPEPLELEKTVRGEYKRLLIIPKYWKSNDFSLSALTYYEHDSEVTREVTKEELAIINAAIEEVRLDYIKRLETYYKKYWAKIYSIGYWVDR